MLQIKELEWLPQPLPPQCKLIVTTFRSDTTYHRLSQCGHVRTLPVPPLSDLDHKADIIKELLAVHCKCLSSEQLDRIVTCRLSDKPLFLAILANELRVFGVYSHLDYHLDTYLEATSIRDLWARIIQRWSKEYGWTPDMASSENGNLDSSQGEFNMIHMIYALLDFIGLLLIINFTEINLCFPCSITVIFIIKMHNRMTFHLSIIYSYYNTTILQNSSIFQRI